MSKWLAAIAAAAISAWACGAVAQHGTPIDDALPVIAVTVTAVAAMTFPAIELAVPLLIGGEIAIADERLRLLWFGIVIGAAFAAACHSERSEEPGRAAVLTVSAILLLRWIPLHNVFYFRELILLAIAIGILAALRWTSIGVAIAVAVALFTPAVPMRTLLFPLAVLVAVVILNETGMPPLRADILASFAIALMLLFFPWSGVFARALPLAVRGLPHATPRAPIQMALAPGQSVTLDVPPNAAALILSGANMSRLRRGTAAGRIDRAAVSVGDFADWGSLRREHFFHSRNGFPSNSAGQLRDYGQCAWIDGAGRFAIPPHATTLRVTADPRLPPAARLQIESFELVTQ